MLKALLLLAHPALATASMLLLVWLFVLLECGGDIQKQAKKVSIAIALISMLVWMVAGYWYITFYPGEKMHILQSEWSFAHRFFMESKEHIFYVFLILSFYLLVVVWTNDISVNQKAKRVVRTLLLLMLLLLMYMDFAGAVVSYGSKSAFALEGM